MCFDADAIPPIADNGVEVECRDLELVAEDGTHFAAFEALGPEPSGSAIVVLPDVRGLYRFYEQLAARFAQHGHDAVAIDYFGRTAGASKRDDGFDYMPHVEQTTFQGVKADVAAAIAHLRSDDSGRKVLTVGFCFGGSNSWHQAANGHGLSGAIGFYGNPLAGRPQGVVPIADRIGDLECPVLALMGGDDPGIPPEEVDAFDEALSAAGVTHEVISYPGAPHSFFDRSYDQFADESADAWRRVLEFVAAHG